MAAQGFTAYALAFVEDENPQRAVKLYHRGRDYAARWVKIKYNSNLLDMVKLDEFEKALKKMPSKAVPGLFWMGNAWASAMMLSLHDVESIANLPKAEMLMRFVLEHDESYYFGGAHLFFCGYYGARPRMLGGSPDKALEHINKQIELTNGTFMLGELFKVKYVSLPALDEAAARAGLEKILEFDIDSAPDTRLVNRVAQEKARTLLGNLEDYL